MGNFQSKYQTKLRANQNKNRWRESSKRFEKLTNANGYTTTFQPHPLQSHRGRLVRVVNRVMGMYNARWTPLPFRFLTKKTRTPNQNRENAKRTGDKNGRKFTYLLEAASSSSCCFREEVFEAPRDRERLEQEVRKPLPPHPLLFVRSLVRVHTYKVIKQDKYTDSSRSFVHSVLDGPLLLLLPGLGF